VCPTPVLHAGRTTRAGAARNDTGRRRAANQRAREGACSLHRGTTSVSPEDAHAKSPLQSGNIVAGPAMPYPRRPPPADSLRPREPWLVTAVLRVTACDWPPRDSNLSFLLTIVCMRPGKRTVLVGLVGAVTAPPHRVCACLLRTTVAMMPWAMPCPLLTCHRPPHAASWPGPHRRPALPMRDARCEVRGCTSERAKALRSFLPLVCLRAMVVPRHGGALSPACEPTPSLLHHP
jgi:hypothetical protein